MTRPDSARCTATYDHGGNGLGTARCGLPANGHDRHRARTVYGEVEWNEPGTVTRPDPARYPAGTRVLVEAISGDDGGVYVLHPGRKPWTVLGRMLDADSVIVHGTVAELELLQAEMDEVLKAPTDSQIMAMAMAQKVIELDALRAERDNLAANAARLRQKYTLATAALDENRGAARELEALRAEVTHIADEMAQTALYGGPSNFLTFTIDRHTAQLRTALATQAPQPAVVAATPPDGAGVDDAPHQPAGGSVGHDRAERP